MSLLLVLSHMEFKLDMEVRQQLMHCVSYFCIITKLQGFCFPVLMPFILG